MPEVLAVAWARTETDGATVRRVGLAEQVAADLTRSIVDGAFPPGTLLAAEGELARQFGVGKSAVREAIRVLSTKGLVEVTQGSGTRVADPSRWNVIDSELVSLIARRGLTMGQLLEVRRSLEPDIVSLAAERATAEEVEALATTVAQTERFETHDHPEYVRLDVGFHTQLAAASHNPIYSVIAGSVFDLLVESRRLLVAVPGATTRGIRHHQLILEAIKTHEPVVARARMLDHLEQVAFDWQGRSSRA